MRYKVYNRVTREFENDFCIVTQDGKVAFWDEGVGWELEPSNDIYVVIFHEEEFLSSDEELEHIILEEFRDGG